MNVGWSTQCLETLFVYVIPLNQNTNAQNSIQNCLDHVPLIQKLRLGARQMVSATFNLYKSQVHKVDLG